MLRWPYSLKKKKKKLLLKGEIFEKNIEYFLSL